MQCDCPPRFDGNFCEIGIKFYIFWFDYCEHIFQTMQTILNPAKTISILFVIDKCSPEGYEICHNGGSCIMNSNGSLFCQCVKEYEGDFCTIGIIIEDSLLQITIDENLCLLGVN